MLYVLTKALLSGAIISAASEVAKRSPALGAVILSLPLVSLLAFVWLWRGSGRQRSHRHLIPIYILVRAANATNVSGASGAAEKRLWVLVCACKFMRPNRAPLFLGCVAPSEAGYCLLTA